MNHDYSVIFPALCFHSRLTLLRWRNNAPGVTNNYRYICWSHSVPLHGVGTEYEGAPKLLQTYISSSKVPTGEFRLGSVGSSHKAPAEKCMIISYWIKLLRLGSYFQTTTYDHIGNSTDEMFSWVCANVTTSLTLARLPCASLVTTLMAISFSSGVWDGTLNAQYVG